MPGERLIISVWRRCYTNFTGGQGQRSPAAPVKLACALPNENTEPFQPFAGRMNKKVTMRGVGGPARRSIYPTSLIYLCWQSGRRKEKTLSLFTWQGVSVFYRGGGLFGPAPPYTPANPKADGSRER